MFSNRKAWIPVIGIMFADSEVFFEGWYVYQITCTVVVSSISLISIMFGVWSY